MDSHVVAPLVAEYLGYDEKIFWRHLRRLAVVEQVNRDIPYMFAPSTTQFLGYFEIVV